MDATIDAGRSSKRTLSNCRPRPKTKATKRRYLDTPLAEIAATVPYEITTAAQQTCLELQDELEEMREHYVDQKRLDKRISRLEAQVAQKDEECHKLKAELEIKQNCIASWVTQSASMEERIVTLQLLRDTDKSVIAQLNVKIKGL